MKNMVREVTSLDFKTYKYIVKRQCGNNRGIDQQDRSESPEINPHISGNVTYDSWHCRKKRMPSSIYVLETNNYPHGKKRKQIPPSHAYKYQPQMGKGLNEKGKTPKIQEKR